MSSNPDGFIVILENFAKRHYCKDLSKNPAWDATWQSVDFLLSRFNAETLGSIVEPPIKYNADKSVVLYKMQFRRADQPDMSAKSGGHRLIFLCDYTNQVIRVLLVYNKGHVKGKETAWWKGLVYGEYDGLP